jgi:hypothetical protein
MQSFPPPGPIVGTLLVEAASKEEPSIIGMFDFHWPCLPFMLFCHVSGWFFAKSGGWLNTVKVVLGFRIGPSF